MDEPNVTWINQVSGEGRAEAPRLPVIIKSVATAPGQVRIDYEFAGA